MSPRNAVLMCCLSALAAGCGQAEAANPDPTRDIDCSVVAFYFKGLAEKDGAPQEQRRSTAAIHEWYALKLREIRIQRGDTQSVLAEAAPILEAVKRDPLAALDELEACTDRAVSDPSFGSFAESIR